MLCSALLGRRRLQLYLPLVRAEVQPGSRPSAPLPQLGIEFGWGMGHTSPQGSSRGSVSTFSGPPRTAGYEGPVTLTGKAASRHWLAVGWGEGPPGSQDAPLPSWGLDLTPWACLSYGSTCGCALVALSDPELSPREHASVTGRQTASGAGVEDVTESPGGIPGLGALVGTLNGSTVTLCSAS